MAKRAAPAGGAPEWIVTFADLMSLLLCFFILLISFSSQDKQKVQVVFGSVHEAFGTQPIPTRAGIIEPDGSPERVFLRNVSNKEELGETTQRDLDFDEKPVKADDNLDRKAGGPEAAASAASLSLRRSLQTSPELIELSRQVVFEETPEGLEISLIDQDGRSMFGLGKGTPQESVEKVLVALAPALALLSSKIAIEGHVASNEDDGVSGWALSAARASAVRDILSREGIRTLRFERVTGRSSKRPFMPEDTTLAANRRVTIALREGHGPLDVRSGP